MDQKNVAHYVRPVPHALSLGGRDPIIEGLESSNSGDVELREYIRILYKYRLVIIACASISLLGALLFGFTATPMYTANSQVRISTYEPVLSATKIEDILQEKSRESNYLDTQIQEMRSFSLGDKVLEDPDIRAIFTRQEEPGFLSRLFSSPSKTDEPDVGADSVNGYKAPIGLIKSYLGSISVKPIRRTSLVNIEATSRDAAMAALMANRHALAYIDWVRSNRIEQQSRGLQFLRAQADELREKVADLEREIADYAEANSIVAVNKDENITVQKMSQLNNLLTAAIGKRIEAEQIWKEAEKSLAHPSAGYDDTSTQEMRSQLATLQSEYGQLSAKFTDSYPRMIQLRSQIDGLKRSIEGQRGQIVMGLKAKFQAAQEEEANLREELDQQKSQTFELSKREVQYNTLNRDLTSSRELLQTVLRQIKETSLAVESNSSNVSVVDLAIVPNTPSSPRKKLIAGIGLLLGLGFGLGLAFLLSYLDNTIKTPEDVGRILGLPSLGVVPSFESDTLLTGVSTGSRPAIGQQAEPNLDESGTSDEATLPALSSGEGMHQIMFVNNPKSLAAEAYRTIRTGILLSQAGAPPRTILVSSAQSSEGKTTSSINLAASLASSGARVVLVDADLRRPSVHKRFNLPVCYPGLVEVITGQMSLEEVMVPDVIKRLTVIRSGRIPPNPAELVGSIEMAALLDRLASEYDYVLIDSPPVLPVTDSVVLSRLFDGVVLVVKGAATPRKVVADARNRLQLVGARLLGAILNDVDITGGDYYYYNRYYHSYYQSDPDVADQNRASL